jgi:hypothetical protein
MGWLLVRSLRRHYPFQVRRVYSQAGGHPYGLGYLYETSNSQASPFCFKTLRGPGAPFAGSNASPYNRQAFEGT